MTEVGNYLEKYTYEYIVNRALNSIPSEIDKREGSIIYDAIATCSLELAEMYMEMRNIYKNTYVLTSQDEYLDYRCMEQGIERYRATKAKKRGVFKTELNNPMSIPVGTRFSTQSDTETISYIVIEPYTDSRGTVVPGSYVLECEITGTKGNSYVGNIIPITYINKLEYAYLDNLIVPARDEETDEELRTRYLLSINNRAFGGNIAQYDEEVKAIDGVGEVQIYPTWNGAGTVKLSVIDAEYNSISDDFIKILKEKIDPENNSGEGLGIAPIGHNVTIATPSIVDINIETNITLASGYSLSQVEDSIKTEISRYILEIKKKWGISDKFNNHRLDIYLAKLNSYILGVDGVDNVRNTKINGYELDLELIQNSIRQELPRIGSVDINV